MEDDNSDDDYEVDEEAQLPDGVVAVKKSAWDRKFVYADGSEGFEQFPRGEGTCKRVAKDMPHLLRARDGYQDFAEGCANSCDEEGEGGTMNPWGWHDELTEADWEMIEKAPLKPAARAILKEYRKDGAQALKCDEF